MRTIFITISIIVVVGLFASPVLAYTLSESIPGGSKAGDKVDTATYFEDIFNFVLAAAAILAVIMIIVGGLQYIGAAGNPSVISDAKDRIYWAILGLILALASVLILQTINPDLLKLDFTVPSTTTGTGGGSSGGGGATGGGGSGGSGAGFGGGSSGGGGASGELRQEVNTQEECDAFMNSCPNNMMCICTY